MRRLSVLFLAGIAGHVATVPPVRQNGEANN